MGSHSRRRSVSSSSSSSSSSSDDESKRRKQHKDRQSHRDSVPHVQPGVPQAVAGDFGYRSLSSDHLQHRVASMSGPGFPNTPPPSYSSPSYGEPNQRSITMPGHETHFTPPSGPPPSFPSAHGPGFPSAEFSKPGYNDAPAFPTSPHDAPSFPAPPMTVGATTESRELGFQYRDGAHPQSPPPRPTPPPSGYRVPLTTTATFPRQQAGVPVSHDLDGSDVFIGSALFERSVHPCKIVPALQPTPCRVPYGGGEHEHNGRFDLLPFDPQTMEWVPTSQGRIPPGRRPVEGGYEEHGGKLYHALGVVQTAEVPGKTGEHLGGANIAFGGGEHVVRDYKILCWR